MHDASTYQRPMVSLTSLVTNIFGRRGWGAIRSSYPTSTISFHILQLVIQASSRMLNQSTYPVSRIGHSTLSSARWKHEKDVNTPKASRSYFMPFQPIKSNKVKEVEFQNVLWTSFEPLHLFIYKEVKEVKLSQCLRYVFKALTST